MKITLQKQELESILTNLQSFLNTDITQITSHILLQTINNEIILKATNNEMGIKAKIQNEAINEDEKITISGKNFLNLIKPLDNEKIELTNDNERIKIKQKSTTIFLDQFIADEFPTFPENYESTKLNIDSKNFIDSLKKIHPIIPNNYPKEEFKNAFIDIQEYKINFVSTDGKRLEMLGFKTQSIDKLNFMISKKAIGEIKKLFNESINIYFSDNNIIIENDKYTFWTRIPNGKYIDYERIIPKSFKYEIIINKEKLLDHLKKANSNTTKFTINKNQITLDAYPDDEKTSKNHDVNTFFDLDSADNKNFIDKIKDENEIIFLNGKHIIDYLMYADTANIKFCINENKNAACIFESDNFTLILMPIIL